MLHHKNCQLRDSLGYTVTLRSTNTWIELFIWKKGRRQEIYMSRAPLPIFTMNRSLIESQVFRRQNKKRGGISAGFSYVRKSWLEVNQGKCLVSVEMNLQASSLLSGIHHELQRNFRYKKITLNFLNYILYHGRVVESQVNESGQVIVLVLQTIYLVSQIFWYTEKWLLAFEKNILYMIF